MNFAHFALQPDLQQLLMDTHDQVPRVQCDHRDWCQGLSLHHHNPPTHSYRHPADSKLAWCGRHAGDTEQNPQHRIQGMITTYKCLFKYSFFTV